ncbi:LysM peptidoglycan-binding domain-containing protein [Altererythrobacter sp. Z27]|uniref:LysM peptidoglycan-binding domain-containing protein n=1 Tax=Altererythrobacter sp. Z27 TaxID=3461147 RepID=UPI004044CA2B
MVAIFTGLGSGFARGSSSVLGSAGQLGSAFFGRGGEGMSVNAATGNLVLSRQDEFLIGRGLDAGILRTYNSLGQLSDDRDNGDRWQQSTTQRIYGLTGTLSAAGSTVKRLSSDGSIVTYAWGTRGGISAYWTTDGSGAHDRLERGSGDTWMWTDGDSQVAETYAASAGSASEWRLVERRDTDGNKLTFSYRAGSDLLDKVMTANGEWLQYTWSGNAITRITTGYTDIATGTAKTLSRTWYDYTDGKLSQVRVDLTPDDNLSPDLVQSYWTRYTYDGSGRVTRILQKDGSQVDIAYDGSGRVSSVTQQVAAGDVRVTSLSYGSGFTSVTGPDGQVTRLDYDAAGQLTKITAPPAFVGAAAQVVQFAYDVDGNLVSVTDAAGKVTRYSYDEFGNVTKIIDPNFNTVERWYDAGNRLVRERTYGSDAASSSVEQNSRFAYDGEGHLRYSIDRDGRVIEYGYNSQGELQYTIEYPEHAYPVGSAVVSEATMNAWRDALADRSSTKVTVFSYDARGNQTQVLKYGQATAAGEGLATEGYSRAYTTYDQAGRLLQRNAQGQAAESFLYDGLGRMTASTDVHGGTTTFVFNDAALTTTVTSASGYTSVQSYNKAGELVSSVGSGNFDVTGASQFRYDKNGRLRMTIDETGAKNFLVYDRAGQLVGKVNHLGQLTEYRLDQVGRVIAEVRYAGTISAANLTKLENPDNILQMSDLRPAANSADIWSWTVFDAVGRVVASIDGAGSVATFKYDASGRIISTKSYANKIDQSVINSYKIAPPDLTDFSALRTDRPLPALGFDEAYYLKNNPDIVAAGVDPFWHFSVQGWREGRKPNVAFDTNYYLSQNPDVAAANINPFHHFLVQGWKEGRAPSAVDTAQTYYEKYKLATFELPGLDPARDKVTRSFYNRSGQLVGMLDGEGYLSEIIYDQAGRKIEEVAYLTRTESKFWNSGTLANLRWSANPAQADNRRVRYVYDGQGQLRYQVNGAGQVTSFNYDAAGNLISSKVHAIAITPADYTYDAVKSAIVADGNDRVTALTYDSAGRLATSTDPLGLVTTYTYDTSGRVIRVQTGSGAAARIARNYYTASGLLRFSIDAEGYVRRYDYDAADRKVREVIWDAPVSVSDATTIVQVNSLAVGAWVDTRWEYDAAGRVSSTYDGLGVRTLLEYNANGTLANIYIAHGTADQTRSHYQYDGAGRITHEYTAFGEAEQALVQHAYDGHGNRTSTTDARGMVTTFNYDVNGRIVSMTEAAGTSSARTTTYQYNAFGDLVQTTDPRGAVTTSIYNRLGQLTRTTDVMGLHIDNTYTAFGELATVSRAGAVTSFQYDKLGRVTRTTDALGFYEAYTYDGLGNRITSRNKLGGVTTYVYDRRGLLTSETLPIGSYNSNGTLAAASVTNTYAYDARGNRTRVTEAAGLAEAHTTTFAYDKANRMVSTTGQAFLGYPAPVTTYTYDARGNRTRMTDPLGASTVYFYDDLGRVTATISPVGTYTTNAYDVGGNVTSVRVYNTSVAVPVDGGSRAEAPAVPAGGHRETIFTYDALGRLATTAVVGAVQTGVFNGSSWATIVTALETSYQYDAVGNVVKVTDPNGNQTFSYYDLLGRKTTQIDGEGYRTDWVYNANGNVLSERRYWNKAAAAGTTAPPAVASDAALDRVTNFTYDLNGNRLTEARTGVVVHNGSGGTSTVTATVSFLYNGLGQVTRKTEASGDQVNYTYDVGGRLMVEARQAFIDHTGASVTPTVDYYYDGLGNLTRTRQRGNANAAERVTTYGYDGGKLRWMTNAEAQEGVITDGLTIYYWYDRAGRQTGEYYTRYNSSGTHTAGFDVVERRYDAAGRVTSNWLAIYNNGVSVDYGPRTVTTYNAHGEVVSVAVGGVTQQQNRYDDAGRVWATSSGDGLWKFLGYDKNGNQTIAITSAGAAFGAATTFQAAFNQIGQTNVNATYTLYDKRGMATQVIEEGRQLTVGGAAQTLTTVRGYNAFGELSYETNALNARIDYTYNAMGRLIRSESPTVEITLENGTVTAVRPTEHYYYDASGRMVASRDANGNLTRITLLAGSGHGGSEALVTSTIYADGGIKQFKYDIHGDMRELVDELGFRTLQTFDRMGRVTVVQEVRSAATTTDDYINYYSYDGLGRQLRHWNNFHQTPVLGDPVWVEDPYDPDPLDGNPSPEPTGRWISPVIGYTPDIKTTDYDIMGRVIATRNFGGDTTSATYVWDAGMATGGLGTFGGWIETTTLANGRTSTQKTDLFGRVTFSRDLGGRDTNYTYDAAGRLASFVKGGLATGYTWLNTGLVGQMWTGSTNAGQVNSSWNRELATYSYDRVGNRLTEQLSRETGVYTPAGWYSESNPYDPGTPEWWEWDQANGSWHEASYDVSSVLLKNQSASYDAIGRLRTWAEAGTATSPASSITHHYDAAGNVRRTQASWRTLAASGQANATPSTSDYWFRFDSMNRLVTNRGKLVNGVITRGVNVPGMADGGQDISYNVAGQRTSVTTTTTYYDEYNPVTIDSKELYTYDAAGRLVEIRQLEGTGAVGSGMLRSQFSYDVMGRQTLQQDYNTTGTQIVFYRSAVYNNKSQLTSDTSYVLKSDSKTYSSSTTYEYGTGADYALGSVVSQRGLSRVNTEEWTYSSTINTFEWYDGAVQKTISNQPNTSQSTTYTTTLNYDGMGRLSSAFINDGKARTVTFVNDELGQIIRRTESRPSNAPSEQTGSPHEVWYRFGGRQMGYTGNNGTSKLSAPDSIADRQVASPKNQGTFRNNQTFARSYADFAQSYDPINSYYQGSAGGSYTVQAGDTLQGIAQNLWGDSSLWYKVAEANGLGAQTGLIEGQRLILPTGIAKNTHNAETTRPYDPSEAIGDISPSTSPKPPKGKKCGTMGAILIAVVAIAVTVVTAGAALAAIAPTITSVGAGIGTVLSGGLVAAAGVPGALAIGAGAAMAGSIVSQAVGVATGIQEKFSWKSVAMAGIGSLVSAGLGQIPGDSWLAAGVRGAAGSAITQGIGVATGLQDKFSWAGVAAAGVGAAVGAGISNKAGELGHRFAKAVGAEGNAYQRIAEATGTLLRGSASAIASAATRSAIEGTSFKDGVIAAIPDVVASTLQSLASACFTGETLIHTPKGLKRIDEIRVGDLVNSRDEGFKDDRVQVRRVMELYRFEDRVTLDLTIAYPDREETFRATPEHPFAIATIGKDSTASDPIIAFGSDGDLAFAADEVRPSGPKSYAWQPAGKLSPGDYVIDINGRFGMVVAIEPVRSTSTVYNFAVEGFHTYFVGKTGTWVHNQYGVADVSEVLDRRGQLRADVEDLQIYIEALGQQEQTEEVRLALVAAIEEAAKLHAEVTELAHSGGPESRAATSLGIAWGNGTGLLTGAGESALGALVGIGNAILHPVDTYEAAREAGKQLLDFADKALKGDINAIDEITFTANVWEAGIQLEQARRYLSADGWARDFTGNFAAGKYQTSEAMQAALAVAGPPNLRHLGRLRSARADLPHGVDPDSKPARIGKSGPSSRDLLRDEVAGILTKRMRSESPKYRANMFKEAKGIIYAARQAERLGYGKIEGFMPNASGHGVDMIVSDGKGRYAVFEAKGGSTQKRPSVLSVDQAGNQQGTHAYNISRFERAAADVNNPQRALAEKMLNMYQESPKSISSYATFYGSRRTYEFTGSITAKKFTGVRQ